MKRFNDIEEGLQWVMSRHKANHDLKHFKDALKKVGSPQDKLKVVHVAGTNGKGSTCFYLANILKASGYKVGLFTSPYLITHLDRIRINDELISEEEFLTYLNQYYDFIEEYDLAMFEIDFLIACSWYRDRQVDYAIIEVGLGGRDDATNVISKPVVEVITTIGYDHMDRLGYTLEDIAYAKAGIIKKDTTVITGKLLEEPLKVIEEVSRQVGAKHIKYIDYKDIDINHFSFDDQVYEISSLAQYQKQNVSLSLLVAKTLGVDIHDEKVVETIKDTKWLGRFEVISDKPMVIIDGAHNEEGINALINSFKNLDRPLVVVYSALKDKKGKAMAELLEGSVDELITTQFEMYRADTAENLASKNSLIIKDWKQAIQYGLTKIKDQGTLVVCGSLYFVSQVRPYLLDYFEK